jgi:preprotein translocase subunit YajC
VLICHVDTLQQQQQQQQQQDNGQAMLHSLAGGRLIVPQSSAVLRNHVMPWQQQQQQDNSQAMLHSLAGG